MQIRLLGGVTATSDHGHALDVGPAKCRVVLAALALSLGEAVPVSRLIDVVWGEDPPRTAPKTLQGYVARLRKRLGPESIVRSGSAYRLDLDPGDVDVGRFRIALTAGDIDGALAVWTGRPLADLHVPSLTPLVDALLDEWLRAVADGLGRRLVTDPAGAIAPLRELTGEYPFHEELWALLMTALYRTGRQADALAAFKQARDHLVGELGVEPGAALRAVEAQVLGQDHSLGDGRFTSAVGRPSPTGTVTFGLVEVTNASQLWVQHRRKMGVAMSRLDELVASATQLAGGTLITSGGESIGVALHRADDAAMWATELRVAADQEPWPGGIELRLQFGLHTGETQEQDGTFSGEAVHVASRLASAGHPGQILVSGVTAAVLERDDLRDLGTHRLDGVAGEHEIRQLDGGDHPALRTASSRRGNLPRRLGSLVGRSDDLDTVSAAMEDSQVVTLVGPGGIGKTTLAVAAAHRAEVDTLRRVWLVELADISDPDDVPRTVADTLGVVGGAGRSVTESITAVLRSRPTLLVLDNCEHVVEAAAALVRSVVDDGSDTRILTTSREGLGIPGEHLFTVEPLGLAAAVELFGDRARAISTTIDLEEAHADVERLCARLDRLPLAIELAAARARTLPPADLLARLDDHLRLLGGGRTGTERHRTMRAAVAWSYDLLTEAQQRLFICLSVFAGPFDLAAAEVVAGGDDGPAETDRLLGELVERSMVSVESGRVAPRFHLLEILRQFAAEHVSSLGVADELAGRHARWCRNRIADIGVQLTGRGEAEGVARLAELWPELRAAVDWACRIGDVALADALVRPIVVEVDLRRRSEIGDWAERVLELTAPEDEASVVFWLLWSGHRHAQAGNHEAWAALLRRYGHPDHPAVRFNTNYLSEVGKDSYADSPEAVRWLRDEGESHSADLVEISGVAASMLTLQRFRELAPFAATMTERHRAQGPVTFQYFSLALQAFAEQYQGRPDAAAGYFEEAWALELPAGTYRVLQAVEARAALDQGDTARGCRLLRDNLDEMLDCDYTDAARMVAVEFIAMMITLDRLDAVAQVLPYLDTTGDYAVMVREVLFADAVRRIESGLDQDVDGPNDARTALTRMRDTVEALIA